MKAFVVFSSMLLAAPALAQGGQYPSNNEPQPATQTASPSTEAESGDERRICRRVESSTGTRLGGARRVCMTEREWRVYERNN